MRAPELPAGYMLVSGVAIHVSELRRHTSDVRRFMRCLPATERFDGLVPCSREWEQRLSEVLADPVITLPDLILTMREAGALSADLADGLGPEAA
jgi:hypothetical protein